MDQLYIRCPASAQHALTRWDQLHVQVVMGRTQLCLLHVLHSWSIYVQEIPQHIYIIYSNWPHTPYIWQITRFYTGWQGTHAPSQCRVCGTPASLPRAHASAPKGVQYIPSEIGSFNITYPNNSSHFKMQKQVLWRSAAPGLCEQGGQSWLAQLLRSDLVSLVRHMPGTNAKAELYQKRPFRRLIITPRPLLEICILKQSYTLNSSPTSK